MIPPLRRHFDDELLTRVGNGYELTPLGERLSDETLRMSGCVTWHLAPDS